MADIVDLIELAARITPQWLAGFFDGEGCVGAYKPKEANCHSVHVVISQKSLRLMTLLLLKFPGGYGPFKSKAKPGNYQVQWYGNNSLLVLNFIKEYVIVKKSQVEAAIEIAEMASEKCQRHETERISRVAELAAQMKESKRAGF